MDVIGFLFPRSFTFFTVLWYIFLSYCIGYAIFEIYIYANGLEYEIDCERSDRCFIIKEKEKEKKEPE